MALEFVDKLPPARRGGATGSRLVTAEVMEELEQNPGRWALVKRGAANAQSFANFVAKHPDYTYASRTQPEKQEDGKQLVDVYLAYDPDKKFPRRTKAAAKSKTKPNVEPKPEPTS